MKFLLLLILTLNIFIYPQSGGIKKSEPLQQYRTHDHGSGLDILRNSVPNEIHIEYNLTNTTPAVLSGGLTLPGYCRNGFYEVDVIRFLAENKNVFGLQNASDELKVISEFTDDLEMTHIKFQQYTDAGIKIYPSEMVVHINSDGSIESVNGNYIPTPVITAQHTLTAAEALLISKNFLGEYKPSGESAEMIFFRRDLLLIPAFEVRLPSKYNPDMVLFINAADGSLIDKDDGLRYDGPAVGSGVGLNGVSRVLHTYLFQGNYYLVDASLPMYVPPFDSLRGVIATYDAKNSITGNGYDLAELVSDPNANNIFDDNLSLRASVDAHAYTQQVYKFLKNNFNRNSFNNLGTTLINVVHYKQNYNNAFWNGVFMTYGDGDGQLFGNLAGALDIVCHEITHGVISSSANLIYRSQSGAINESMADVFAVLLDSTDWLIGEDVFTPGIPGDALRNMQNPANGQPVGSDFWQPSHMNEYVLLPETEEGDWGGVHINSGIPNKAFYNTASVTGRWKAGQIWYRTLTAYLTSNSQFRDLRISALLAAKDLYGMNSAEYTAVQNAFDNVGILSSSPTYYQLVYDDGIPDIGVYENQAGWKLAVNFTSPAPNINIEEVSVYLNGDANLGSGRFTLELFDQNTSGLPGNSLVSQYTYTPVSPYGWHSFTVTNLNISKNFFVSMLYDGINWTMIGADSPPGNNRAYEYSPLSQSWYKLTGSENFTLFMRAKVSSMVTDVEIETAVPSHFEVTDNFPNPFNPSTSIKYSLPAGENVSIVVYDLTGRKVAELASGYHNAGTYTVTWNGRSDAGESSASGVYYCRIEAGSYNSVKKMILMK